MEKKDITKIEDNKGNLILENRKRLTLSGVLEVISFDEEKILLNSKNNTKSLNAATHSGIYHYSVFSTAILLPSSTA